MPWADVAILAVLGLSALVSLFRGFVREAISLLGWIAAFWVALTFMEPVARVLDVYIEAPSLRAAAAFLGLFLGILMLTAVVNFVAGMLIDKTGLTGTDRVLGTVFGAARGALIIGGIVLLAGITAIPQDRWWRESLLIPHFETLALEIRKLLPADMVPRLEPNPPSPDGIATRVQS
ncbi:MAG: membrane protein required for colicin V production [Gammaproteobacteria bacterium]|jgi:membrane protein required for colicin V production